MTDTAVIGAGTRVGLSGEEEFIVVLVEAQGTVDTCDYEGEVADDEGDGDFDVGGDGF